MEETKSANGREPGILDALKLLFECDPECSALRPDYPALPGFFFTIDGQLACPVKGHAVMSVKVRPEPKDSGFEAREAPWRESKTAEPSDNMLERSVREASGCNVQ